jgi:hypothetical protein
MDFIPGFCQGVSRVLVSHPFDYIRLHLQTNKYNSIKDVVKNIKFNKLYKGVSVPLISIPIERAIQFKCFEYFSNKDLNPFISGSLCGCVNTIFSLPSSYICNNFILSKTSTNLALFIKNELKIKNIYNGFKPELIRSISASGIYLGVYGSLRNKYGNNIYQSIINSTISGWSVWTLTYPFETIKIEQQIKNQNIITILKNRIYKYGIFNLWKGITPIYIRTIPSSIIGMIVYEEVRKNII